MTPAVAVIAIARREVAAAARSGMCATRMSNGTARMPPPTPKNAEKTPAASPMATRRTSVSYECDQSRRHRRASRPRLVGGGGWIRLVNRPATPCAPAPRRECYVADLDLSRLRVSEEARGRLAGLVTGGRALARGTLVTGRVGGFPELATLAVSEVWTASSSPRKPEGAFQVLRDNGVRCITAPCFSIHAARLNEQTHSDVSGVRLGTTG